MSHQDLPARGLRTNSADLRSALQWLLAGVDLSAIRFRTDCTWSPQWLIWTSLLWAWSDEQTLLERFACAQRLICHLQGHEAKAATSYQAFLKVLKRWTSGLVALLQMKLRKRMETFSAYREKQHGWIVFGVDGSKIDLPRTHSHQQAYAPARPGAHAGKRNRRRKPYDPAATKKTLQPQMWLTMLYHVGLHLPWDWRIGPADSSERAHALDMLASLPDDSLLTADAGFVGYEFAQRVLAQGCQFLVRVGSNVKLLKKLGYVRESLGTVYVWPEKAAQRSRPPLVFRLIMVQGTRHPVFLMVSILNRSVLTNQEAADLYRARWGVEVFYRHLKQTFQRRKLRSHCAENACVELQWSLIGLWSIGLYASRELNVQRIPLERLSLAKALAAFRRVARDYLHPIQPTQRLRTQLHRSVQDHYQRGDKSSRDYPRKKKERPAGAPVINIANPSQIQQAQRIKQISKKG
jgi:hypothetical protein